MNENILEKQKIRGEERNYDVTLSYSTKNKGYLKRIYMREGKKEKKSMR